MIMKNFLLPALTKAINTYLDLDPESKDRLRKLSGKAITIELLPFHFVFQCCFYADSIAIQTDSLLETETNIRGTPLQMLGVMMTKENRQRFFADDIRIEGNAELAQDVIALFDELDIDWEENLSRFIGDVPAFRVGNVLRDATTWLKQAKETLTQDVNEYVHEEAMWFPNRESLQDFFADIDTLRMDVDRIEARVKQLREKLNHPTPFNHAPEDEGSQ